MRCERFQSQLEDYLADVQQPEDRSAWRLHLQECGECRVWALTQEPTLVFLGEPAEADADSEQIRRCVDSVSAMIRQDALGRRLRWRPRLRLGAAAAALVSVLGGAMWMTGFRQHDPVVAEEYELHEKLPVVRPEVEFDMDGEGVRIYQLADDDDTAVWFVVNPDLES
jgi:hypothetical protein